MIQYKNLGQAEGGALFGQALLDAIHEFANKNPEVDFGVRTWVLNFSVVPAGGNDPPTMLIHDLPAYTLSFATVNIGNYFVMRKPCEEKFMHKKHQAE